MPSPRRPTGPGGVASLRQAPRQALAGARRDPLPSRRRGVVRSAPFPAPSPAQADAWPAIKAGRHTLIAAPTGSGKTLAAFLAAIDDLVRQGLDGTLDRRDAGRLRLAAEGAVERHPSQSRSAARRHPARARSAAACPTSRSARWVRTGDTAAIRARADAPQAAAHSGDDAGIALRAARLGIRPRDAGDRRASVIVDEIHAVAPQQARRASRAVARAPVGALRRPAAAHRPLGDAEPDSTRSPVFWSAPPRTASRAAEVAIVDAGHQRAARPERRDPGLAARGGHVQRGVDAGLRPARRAHRGHTHHAGFRQHAPHGRTRRARACGAPRRGRRRRASRQHGQGAAARRRAAAQARRTEGDGGDRLARTRHRHRRRRARLPARFAALDRDVPAARRPLRPRDRRHAEGAPVSPVARRSGRMRGAARRRPPRRARPARQSPNGRSTCSRSRSSPRSRRRTGRKTSCSTACGAPGRTATLTREEFDAVVRMLARRLRHPAGRRGALIHRDAVNGILRGRRGARTTALTSGGAIPDTADYQVLLEPENHVIGTRQRGFRRREHGGRRVPARQRLVSHLSGSSAGPSGSRTRRGSRRTCRSGSARRRAAPMRCRSPSRVCAPKSKARLRADPSGARAATLARGRDRRRRAGRRAARRLSRRRGSPRSACCRRRTRSCSNGSSTKSGGMQLVIHAPFGSRINRAWGLALRKRFCRKFNFELQAAATEDAIVLSLTTAHSFRARATSRATCNANSVRPLLVQAMLDAPMFAAALALGGGRFARAAALPRRQEGSAADPAHAGRGPDRRRVPGPDRLRRKPRRRARSARPSAGQPGGQRLPARGDGHRGPGAAAAPHRNGRGPRRLPRSDRSPRRSRSRCCRRSPTPSSTTRRSRSGGRRR